MKVLDYYYNRKAIQTGILHIGVGNFHRAHQAFYTNQLLRDEDQSEWGICGASLLPSDEKIVNNLRSQNLEYTLTVCGRDGRDEVYKIGAINDLIWTVEAPQDLLNKIADSSTKIITLTITEGGYNLDKATNEFILENESIQHDLKTQNLQLLFSVLLPKVFVLEKLKVAAALLFSPVITFSTMVIQPEMLLPHLLQLRIKTWQSGYNKM